MSLSFGNRSSEVAAKFQQVADRRGHTSRMGTYIQPLAFVCYTREGGGMCSLVSTAVCEFELAPFCRMHFDHSWLPHIKSPSANPQSKPVSFDDTSRPIPALCPHRSGPLHVNPVPSQAELSRDFPPAPRSLLAL